MHESLNVIALISGGKDSIFSILHCWENGHKVVALANLHPQEKTSSDHKEEENDLNSFMYQTVGRTVIPLFKEALGDPLYRQPISGSAVQIEATYSHFGVRNVEKSSFSRNANDSPTGNGDEDETESLVPLLQRIMKHHPEANALSTGAILSTYQRTRVESVALRLGLNSLAYLWKYPTLPPGTPTSLLQDMSSIGLDARIVKVASGGLDESFLWQNVADTAVIKRVENAIRRFGMDDDGSALGEGGEFETLVVDGPDWLFRGRIEVQDRDRRVVREEGGTAWLQIRNAKVVMKENGLATEQRPCRVPNLLDSRFAALLDRVSKHKSKVPEQLSLTPGHTKPSTYPWSKKPMRSGNSFNGIRHCTVTASVLVLGRTIEHEASKLISQVRQLLAEWTLESTDIVSTFIILRSMKDFAVVNKIYETLFTKPNPPARVTISCGDLLPDDINIMIHLKIHEATSSSPPRRALHVQSRSYWAPANIGPYSQAVSIPLRLPNDEESTIWTVHIAGQIPLIPQSMTLPSSEAKEIPPRLLDNTPLSNFNLQSVLALQHLWRIGKETQVKWWTSVVAYLPREGAEAVHENSMIAAHIWDLLHAEEIVEEDGSHDDERDIWEERHNKSRGFGYGGVRRGEEKLPDWRIVEIDEDNDRKAPPFFAVEVEELPRGSAIEWHAHLGISDGPVKIHSRQDPGRWTICQTAFGTAVQTIVTIYHREDDGGFDKIIQVALKTFGLKAYIEHQSYTLYVDVSSGVGIDEDGYGGVVPCRSIRDEDGRRVDAVLLFDTLPEILI